MCSADLVNTAILVSALIRKKKNTGLTNFVKNMAVITGTNEVTMVTFKFGA